MEDNRFTRLTIEQTNYKVSWEIPYTDPSANDLIKGFRCLLDGITFYPEHFNHMLANFLMEYGSDEYDVIEKTESSDLYEDEKEETDEAMPHFELENCSFGDIIKPYKGYKAEICENGQVIIKKVNEND